jgi:hypothetical protein
MKKITIFIFLILTLIYFFPYRKNQYIPSEKQKLTTQILKQVSQELQGEAHLYKVGDEGKMFDQIELLGLMFSYYEPLDEDKARKLLIYSIDKLVATVNANQKIRPYLANYPFTPQNVRISIALFKPDGSIRDFGDLSFVVSNAGKLKYVTSHPDLSPQKVLRKETYDEAVAKIAAENSKRIIQEQIK